ncbi:MAG: nucleotide exchange factor GrpE [Bacillota bacterium]
MSQEMEDRAHDTPVEPEEEKEETASLPPAEEESTREVTEIKTAAEEEAPPPAEEDPLARLLAELEAERQARRVAEERALRYRADFENLRRRTQLEAEKLRERLLGEIVTALLPVLDDMERALAAAGAEAPPSWAAGLELVYRRFLTVLNAQGVVRLETLGQPFDPEKHEAIGRVEDSGQPANTIVEELRAGYALGDRVLRPALVKVQA